MIIKAITALSLVAALGMALGGKWLMLPVYFAGSFLLLFAVAVAFCFSICAFVDMDKPVERDSKFYRFFMYLYIEFLMNVLRVKVKTTGLEKTPTDGRFLLVCNHQQMADPGILHHFFKKSQLAFISKKENEKLPVINKFMHKTLCQSIDREDDRQGLRVIVKCIQMLKNDQVSIGVFPEGGTNHDDKLHPFRPGVFKIAQKANVPIVVCTINGTRPLFHNLKTYSKTPVELHLVEVIPAEQLQGVHTTQIAQRVYDSMLADLGEEYRAEA